MAETIQLKLRQPATKPKFDSHLSYKTIATLRIKKFVSEDLMSLQASQPSITGHNKQAALSDQIRHCNVSSFRAKKLSSIATYYNGNLEATHAHNGDNGYDKW